MKQMFKVTIAMALIVLAIVFISAKPGAAPQAATGEYAILTYFPYSGSPYIVEGERYSVRIFYGNKNAENVKISREELSAKQMSTIVASVLDRLSGEGYQLVSTITTGNASASTEIHCFLKKAK